VVGSERHVQRRVGLRSTVWNRPCIMSNGMSCASSNASASSYGPPMPQYA